MSGSPKPAAPAPKGKKEWHLVTGGIAGGVSRTVTAPLERLKILRQLDTPEFLGLNMWQVLKKFYTVEGIKGFFKGNGSNVVKIVPFSALEFYSFEFFKDLICPKNDPRNKVGLLLSGSCAGILATVVTYPMDFVRTVLSIQTDYKYKGMWDCMAQVYKQSGLIALYRGMGMSCIGIAPFIGFKMSSFDLLKAHYLPKPTDPNFAMMNLVLGSAAGTIAASLTYPTDVIRRKMQLLVNPT